MNPYINILFVHRILNACEQQGERRFVMLALASHCDPDGRCHPSQETIARETRCSLRGVKKIIDSLIEQGEIELLCPGGGRAKSARYRLTRYAADSRAAESDSSGREKEEWGSSFPTEKEEPCSPFEKQKEARIVPLIASQRGNAVPLIRHRSFPETGNVVHEKGNLVHERVNAAPEKGEQLVPPNNKGNNNEEEIGQTHSSPKAERRGEKFYEPSEAGFQFADWFHEWLPDDGHKANLPPNFRRHWASGFDDLVKFDHRDAEAIYAVSAWARKDSFWAQNFLSPMKLRERDRNGTKYFDVFTARMKQPAAAAPKFTSTRDGAWSGDLARSNGGSGRGDYRGSRAIPPAYDDSDNKL